MISEFAVSKGANIRYHIYSEEKKGETLVFLHGNGENSGCFENSAHYFENEYRVVTIDSRGHGESDLGGDPLTVLNMAEDLYAVFNHLRIPKATVIGYSDGANIAMVFAGKHRERVEKLVLYGGNYNNSGLSLGFRIRAAIGCFMAKLAAKIDENALRNYRQLALMSEDQHIDESILRSITAKTFVFSGEKDLIKPEHTKKISSLIPNCEYKIIDGADHFYPYNNNEKFNEDIKKFIEGK